MVLVKQLAIPTENVKLQTALVEAFTDNENLGIGNLYISEDCITWIDGNTGEGFKVAYKKMTLHAISRDPVVHARACLYIMINGNVLDEEEAFVVECPPDYEMDDADEEMTEIRFVPENDALLDAMYKTVQECSLLHPDPTSSSEGSNDEDPYERFEGLFISGDDDNDDVDGDDGNEEGNYDENDDVDFDEGGGGDSNPAGNGDGNGERTSNGNGHTEDHAEVGANSRSSTQGEQQRTENRVDEDDPRYVEFEQFVDNMSKYGRKYYYSESEEEDEEEAPYDPRNPMRLSFVPAPGQFDRDSEEEKS